MVRRCLIMLQKKDSNIPTQTIKVMKIHNSASMQLFPLQETVLNKKDGTTYKQDKYDDTNACK